MGLRCLIFFLIVAQTHEVLQPLRSLGSLALKPSIPPSPLLSPPLSSPLRLHMCPYACADVPICGCACKTDVSGFTPVCGKRGKERS